MTKHSLAVVSAGLSQPSSTRLLADQLASATRRSLYEQEAESSVDVIELRDHAHDLTNQLITGVPTGNLHQAIDSVAKADGLIAVTPIFNASYSGLFKSFFDVLEPESLSATPALIAATGGTPRHSLALEHAVRPLFTYMQSVVAPTAVYAAAQDWGAEDSYEGALADRIDRASSELATMIIQRGPGGGRDPFDDPTPFEDLLAGS